MKGLIAMGIGICIGILIPGKIPTLRLFMKVVTGG